MLDFLMISYRSTKRGMIEIYPKFIVGKSKDLMTRGGDFYAVWNEEKGMWSCDEQDLIHMIDKELDRFAKDNKDKFQGEYVKINHMWDSETNVIDTWHKYCQKQQRDYYKPLDETLIFSNQTVNRDNYSTKKLNYPLEEGNTDAYDKMMSILYSDDERHKIEWAIGSIVTGNSKKIQKFLVLYGPPGSGKSTVLNIVQMLFDGYYSVFDAESLGSSSDVFALEQFKSNPLVAISHDGDLSHIEKNTRINSLVSHEQMTVNEKHKSLYSTRFNSFLMMGTNKPVKITDAKSGIIRRLIDVHPTGNKLPLQQYNEYLKQIEFELGGIAWHCMQVYLEDPNYYNDYKPSLMMEESNDFYNFVSDCYEIFKKENGVTLKEAWSLYKEYCEEAKIPYPFTMRTFRGELKNYFKNYEERIRVGEEWVRSFYSDFRNDLFEAAPKNKSSNKKEKKDNPLNLKEQPSKFDILFKDYPAQYGSSSGTPISKWSNCKTKLSDLDTSKVHYVKVPINHIVIDFDIPDENGNKCLEKNIEEASKWPKTYTELSKSGCGVHLHYIYNGDPNRLSRIYSDHIEVKVFSGNSSLRRRLTLCNDEDISTISSGLPMKGEDKMVNFDSIKNEKSLRTIIKRNLNKEYHSATKPSIDFIAKVLEDAYNSGMCYDVRDMYNVVLAFAASSSHQSDYCIKIVSKMHFNSENVSDAETSKDDLITFYDVEVFPNLFIINWKYEGKGQKIVRMINPTPAEVEALCKHKLVGFNCRRYDNHILYARMMGKTNEQLFELSQKIVSGVDRCLYKEAYNISYTDIYDFTSLKQSLKQYEIDLGIHHQELGLPWDKPVPEELWTKVAEYCDNDVIATEAVWNDRKADFVAREILADLAGMTVNDTTNSLTTKIVFGNERNPKLNYTNLATGEQTNPVANGHHDMYKQDFPGYELVFDENDKPHNMFMGTDLGFGGYVYAEPGMYGNVALLDVMSLHPHSAIAMDAFGEYTKNFEDLVNARIFIKHKEYDKAKLLFHGKLAKYLDDPSLAKMLAQALKIAINSVYGLTSATFKNPFKDDRNVNNIIALRGALFMRSLQEEVTKRGFKVAHIKTDSIKIPDATPEIISFCMDYAKKYGYEFEHEATYERMCLVNKAVYIAKYKDGEHANQWTATGAQFQIPYVFKKCFSHEDIEFKDLCETKSVKSAMYLNYNENLPDGEDDLRFIGKVGLFCPIKPGAGGALLVKPVDKKDGSTKMDAVTGTIGYRWLESEEVYNKGKQEDIDLSYYDNLVNSAIGEINQYCDYEWFVSDDPYVGPNYVNGQPDYKD